MRTILRAGGTHWGDWIGPAGLGGERTEFRLVNQVGTLVANGDSSGNFVEGCLSGPFGDGQQCTGAYDYTETHFTDKLRDAETNNDYFGARYFNSVLGRFLSPDPSGLASGNPADPQSLNLYSYGLNNPLSNMDPTGLSCIHADDGTPGDDGDGQGCAAAGVDRGQSLDDYGTVKFNQNHTDTVYVTAPQQGQDLNYDADVANDQQFLQRQQLQQQVLPDDQRMQQLATGVTVDSQHSFGCIAQAYGLGTPGESARYMGQPVEGTKPFITPGTSRRTSPISDLARSLPRVRGSFTAPVGGPGTGSSLRMARTGSLNVAVARYAPFVGAAFDALAVSQLVNCLGHP